MCAQDSFPSVVSSFLCVSPALSRLSLSLCISTHKVEIFSCEPTETREIKHPADVLDVVQVHRGPALNSSDGLRNALDGDVPNVFSCFVLFGACFLTAPPATVVVLFLQRVGRPD